jgi:hypothetical protein
MVIAAPVSVSAGGTFTITVTDQKGEPIEGAEVTIEYASGGEKTLITDDEGKVSVTALESGTIQISVTMAGYDTKAASTEVVAGFDWLIVLIVLMVVLGGVALFLYWRQLPDIGLGKEVSGQSVTLRVKNRSGEQLDNVMIVDAVPTGAFISCNVTPRIESYGSEDHITWFASLNPDEEIRINYQAMRTSESFLVRVGDEEYHSGYGIVSILRELIDKIMKRLPLRKKNAAVAPGAPPPTV